VLINYFHDYELHLTCIQRARRKMVIGIDALSNGNFLAPAVAYIFVNMGLEPKMLSMVHIMISVNWLNSLKLKIILSRKEESAFPGPDQKTFIFSF